MPSSPAVWSLWITILMITASGASVISGLVEAKNTAIEINTVQTRDINDLKMDRRMQDQISQMSNQITRLEVLVSTLETQCKESGITVRRR